VLMITKAGSVSAVIAGSVVLVPGEDDVVVEDEPERGPQAEADDVGRDVVRQR